MWNATGIWWTSLLRDIKEASVMEGVLFNFTSRMGQGGFGAVYHCQCDITNRDVAIKILKSEAKKRRLPREKRKEQLLGEQEEKERSFLSSSQNSYVVDYYGSFVGPSPESVKSQTQDSNKKQESTLLQQDLPLKQFDVDVNQDLMGTLAIGDTATATATAAVGDSADDYLIGHLDTMAGDDEEETVIENTHRERTRLDILSGFRAMGMGRKKNKRNRRQQMMRGPAAFLAEHSSQTFITNKHGNDRRRKQQHEIPDTFNRTITMGHRQVLSSSSDPPDSSSHPTVQIKDADDTDSHSNGRSTSNAIDPEIDIKIETSIKADTFVDSENDESKPNPDHIDLDSGKSYVKRDHSNTSNLHETKDEEERENNDNDCAFVHNTVLYNESSSDTVIVHGTFDISTENKNPSDAENKQIENKKVNDNEECNEGKIRTMEHALREQEVPTAYLDMFMNTDSNGVKAATVNANMGVNDSNDHALCTYEHAATAAAAAVEEKFVWMVMEYAPLGSVRDIMAVTKRTFGEYRVSAILRDVLLGLDYLHSNRKCHRDLKSANVLLTKDKCKLADFGVSAELNETNELKSSIVGTLSFMAPEVLNTAIEEYAGWRADIWSLGCLCHELAVGYSPFKGYSFHEMMTCSTPRFENRKREKTDKHPNVWSDEIQDFLAVCCVADPLKRPGARDLLGHPFIAKYAKDATAILSTLYQEAKETVDRYKVCKKKHDFNPCSLRGEPYDDCARAFENSVNQYVFDNPTRPDFDDLNLGLLALASPHQQQGHFGQPQQRGSQRALGGESEFDMQGHRNRNAGETVDSIAGLFASPGGMGGLMIGNPNQPHQYQQQHNAGNNIDHDSFMNKSVEIGDGNFNIGNLNGNPGANLAAGNVGAFQGMTEATAFQVLPGNISSPQPSEIDPRSRPYEGTHSAAATVDQSDEYAANSFGFGLEGENDYRLQQQQQYQQMGLGLGVHSDTVRQVGSSLTVRMNDLTVDNDSVSGMSLSNTSHTASTRKNNDSCEISHGPV